jgi:hypothetical protein
MQNGDSITLTACTEISERRADKRCNLCVYPFVHVDALFLDIDDVDFDWPVRTRLSAQA